MMKGGGVGIWLLALGFTVPLEGQSQGILDQLDYESDRFDLFTECAPIDNLYILADDEIEAMVENRLQAARLGPEERLQGPSLVIALTPFPLLVFSKWLTDPITGLTKPTATMRIDYNGPVSRLRLEARYGPAIPSERTLVSDILDEFIAEYTRVNEGSCE